MFENNYEARKIVIDRKTWRTLLVIILFIIWLVFSLLIVEYLVTEGNEEWWIIIIPLVFNWFLFFGIAYPILKENASHTK
jgi:hypothetical protein